MEPLHSCRSRRWHELNRLVGWMTSLATGLVAMPATEFEIELNRASDLALG